MKLQIIEKKTGVKVELDGPLQLLFEKGGVVNTSPSGLLSMIERSLKNDPEVISVEYTPPEKGTGDDYPVIPQV